jgi:isopentenyl diphosphate isomerase/L-lactate dehydrogenase-like FMN-dependent dehydrogenase
VPIRRKPKVGVERVNGILQDRLTKAMRLAGIDSIEAAQRLAATVHRRP